MSRNVSLYAAPLIGALAGVIALFAGRPDLVPSIGLVAVGWVAGWFVLAARQQAKPRAAEAPITRAEPTARPRRLGE